MLAIAGGKGGTGKTTTALGLAAAADGFALVVDADVEMPDLHALAGVARSPTVAAVADGPIATAQSVPDRDGVAVLPAPTSTDDRTGLRAAVARCRHADAVVVVDCPAGAGPDVATPLRVADAVLLVSTACAPALRDAAKTAALARALGTQPVGAVLTRTGIAPDAVVDLLGCPVVGVVPDVAPPVLDAAGVRTAYRRAADRLGLGAADDGRPGPGPAPGRSGVPDRRSGGSGR